MISIQLACGGIEVEVCANNGIVARFETDFITKNRINKKTTMDQTCGVRMDASLSSSFEH